MITGKTRVYAIVADPITHVRTPEMLNPYLANLGIDAVVVPWHVRADDFPAIWQSCRHLQNLGGLVITLPHKVRAARLCDSLGNSGRQVGAVNAVRRERDGRMHGDMFDGQGFIGGLRRQDIEPRGMSTLLVGAGGAGSAIAYALAEAGVAKLTLTNRNQARAEALAKAVTAVHPQCPVRVGKPDPTGYQLVVNATSLGLRRSDPLPVDPDRLEANAIVAEVIMRPDTTPLLEAAEARGCLIHRGRHMLEEQRRLLVDFLAAR